MNEDDEKEGEMRIIELKCVMMSRVSLKWLTLNYKIDVKGLSKMVNFEPQN